MSHLSNELQSRDRVAFELSLQVVHLLNPATTCAAHLTMHTCLCSDGVTPDVGLHLMISEFFHEVKDRWVSVRIGQQNVCETLHTRLWS